jgi:hypothetical protein
MCTGGNAAVKAICRGPQDRLAGGSHGIHALVRRARKPVQMSPPKVTESARRRREYWEEFLGALRLDDPDTKVPAANTLVISGSICGATICG